jgi:hypothetical protein
MTGSSVMRLRGSRDTYWSESRTLGARMTRTGHGIGHWSSDLRSHATDLGLIPEHATSLDKRGPKVPISHVTTLGGHLLHDYNLSMQSLHILMLTSAHIPYVITHIRTVIRIYVSGHRLL